MTESARWFVDLSGEIFTGIGAHTNDALNQFVEAVFPAINVSTLVKAESAEKKESDPGAAIILMANTQKLIEVVKSSDDVSDGVIAGIEEKWGEYFKQVIEIWLKEAIDDIGNDSLYSSPGYLKGQTEYDRYNETVARAVSKKISDLYASSTERLKIKLRGQYQAYIGAYIRFWHKELLGFKEPQYTNLKFDKIQLDIDVEKLNKHLLFVNENFDKKDGLNKGLEVDLELKKIDFTNLIKSLKIGKENKTDLSVSFSSWDDTDLFKRKLQSWLHIKNKLIISQFMGFRQGCFLIICLI